MYGLGDLSEILDERAYAQAEAILETMREDMSKVVVTDAYQRAAAALDNTDLSCLSVNQPPGRPPSHRF